VTLLEKEGRLGGQTQYARIPPHKELYGEWLDWQIDQIRRANITIKTGTEVTEDILGREKPEYVILATGGEKIVPDIPGIDRSFVCDAWQILRGDAAPAGRVLVIGGGLIGMETADYLSERGSEVTLVEMLKRSPVLKITSHGYMLHTRLREKKCRLLFATTVTSIGEGGVEIETAGEKATIAPIDQVVVAVGVKPRDELRNSLESLKIPYTVIGDAKSARRIIEATEEGARAAWEL